MGQATLDLPDPLESPPVSPASTDDLLAQMAGQEIERLLSEADEDGAAAPAAPVPTSPAKTSAVAAIEKAPAVVAAAQPASEQDLNALFSQLEDSDEGKAKTPAKSEPAKTTTDAAPSVAEELAEEMAEDAALMAKGPGGLKGDGAGGNAAAIDAREPILLRLLAWFNSPLDTFSDPVRDAVGKIAILTTVNAISILVYVLFFRHH